LAHAGNPSTGWSTPKPTYPYQARQLRRQGSGGVRVTTNGTGRVVNAEMLPGIDPLLDAVAVNFARSAWTGPPNCTRVVAITFSLE
jgi:outer membrane biosynthesis protein TonB